MPVCPVGDLGLASPEPRMSNAACGADCESMFWRSSESPSFMEKNPDTVRGHSLESNSDLYNGSTCEPRD